ncbi:MAG TPA: DUF3626 domain-containing protein [Candidatus Xenobia bacterium]|jgi:hypothetical protein
MDAALAHIRRRAGKAHSGDVERATRVLSGTNMDSADLVESLFRHARVALNFHPDRLLDNGLTVAQGLLADGRYRSQFDTGISNGGRTAYPGGDRHAWEQALFGGGYPDLNERPKYGALNLMHYADGPAPRFGSCHFVLHAHMHDRCTYTFGDSHGAPSDVGTRDAFLSVLAGLLETVDQTGNAVGRFDTTVPELLLAMREPRPAVMGAVLDHYIEAQVHGPIALHTDVERLVVDPSFQGTATGNLLVALGLPLSYHEGFQLPARDVPEAFRGPAIPPLAARIARDYRDPIDAATIGEAAAHLPRDPETLQHVKQLWHVLVQHGRPWRTGA